MKRLQDCLAAATLAAGFVGSAASAGLTPINSPGFAEPNHVGLLNGIYGGSFGPAWASPGASSYSNGTITATRIDDFGVGGNLNLVFGGPGSADDQTWTDGIATTSAQARFSARPQEFGYDLGAVGGYTKLFDVTGSGFDVTGAAAVAFSPGAIWAWVRVSDSDAGSVQNPRWSKNSLNADGMDHMITYQITGLKTQETVWLLFFEDTLAGGKVDDFDYNDLVIEVRAIPTPGALALLGLAVALPLRARRR